MHSVKQKPSQGHGQPTEIRNTATISTLHTEISVLQAPWLLLSRCTHNLNTVHQQHQHQQLYSDIHVYDDIFIVLQSVAPRLSGCDDTRHAKTGRGIHIHPRGSELVKHSSSSVLTVTKHNNTAVQQFSFYVLLRHPPGGNVMYIPPVGEPFMYQVYIYIHIFFMYLLYVYIFYTRYVTTVSGSWPQYMQQRSTYNSSTTDRVGPFPFLFFCG